MEQTIEPSVDTGIDASVATDRTKKKLASEVFLFLHAGGLPTEAVSQQFGALRCFGKPLAHFDLEGPMWSAMNGSKADSFADYLAGLIDRTTDEGGNLSALIDYRDLLWLEQRPIFQEQLRQRLRVVRLAFLDPALQAFRRTMVARPQRMMLQNGDGAPGFAELARELVEIEEAEQLGDVFCKRHGLPMVKLWVEDLARPGVPALRGLLDRWSTPLPENGHFLLIDSPSHSELETVAAFRAEADRRHWSHALLPNRS